MARTCLRRKTEPNLSPQTFVDALHADMEATIEALGSFTRPEGSPKPTPVARSRPHILVVDDDALVCDVAQRMLEVMGYHVTSCPSAREALLLQANADPPLHAALVDLRMPDMDGIAVAQRLRRTQPDLGVVLWSGAPMDAETAPHVAALRGEFLLKPASMASMETALKRCVTTG